MDLDQAADAGDCSQHPDPRPLTQVPASLTALPEFNAIIRACWQQRDHRRPTAREVHAQLRDLAAKHGLLPENEAEGTPDVM
jgi:hypothetical protein